ncbi:MAG TPA: hypothetical protein VEA63_13610 [Opitutus sp.]|nr:hypothetical protein [Opitutus sp.]
MKRFLASALLLAASANQILALQPDIPVPESGSTAGALVLAGLALFALRRTLKK